ncbi:unnamed protein product [Ophioblennius macclurei]
MSKYHTCNFTYNPRFSLCMCLLCQSFPNTIYSQCIFAETPSSNLHDVMPRASLSVVSFGVEANPGTWCGVGSWDGVIYEEASEGEGVALMCSMNWMSASPFFFFAEFNF